MIGTNIQQYFYGDKRTAFWTGYISKDYHFDFDVLDWDMFLKFCPYTVKKKKKVEEYFKYYKIIN